ncbi:MAG: hypothetical protein M8353_02845 [ANME-2 cluster archaeon]|nr:hypothetical protein [ANME-2 cluster archaeon]
MSELENNTIDSIAFTVMVMLLLAGGVSAILGLVIFVHSQYMILFTVLVIIFLAIVIGLSFINK